MTETPCKAPLQPSVCFVCRGPGREGQARRRKRASRAGKYLSTEDQTSVEQTRRRAIGRAATGGSPLQQAGVAHQAETGAASVVVRRVAGESCCAAQRRGVRLSLVTLERPAPGVSEGGPWEGQN